MSEMETLRKDLHQALKRIEALEKLVATIRINASAHINAHTDLLRLIVVSTDCLPPGKDVAYQHIDVGR